MICDGRTLHIDKYPELYSVIGHTFTNHDSIETIEIFRLPDLRGLFIRGYRFDRKIGSVESFKISDHIHKVKRLCESTVYYTKLLTERTFPCNMKDTTENLTTLLYGSETRPYNKSVLFLIKVK